jgi:ADP-heptose:LPS heptosyltransferase
VSASFTVSRSQLAQLFFSILAFFVRRRPISGQKSLEEAKRILLFKPDGIGDFILWSVVFQELDRRCSNAKITILCCAPTGELVRRMFANWKVVQIPRRPKNIPGFLWMLLKHPNLFLIKKQDVLLDLRPHRASWELLYVILLCAVYKVGLQRSASTFRGAALPEERFFDLYIPEAEACRTKSDDQDCAELNFVRQLSARLWRSAPTSIMPDLRFFSWPIPKMPAGKKFWVIGPFSGNAIRDYPLPKWKEVFQQLVSQAPGPDCLLICGAPSQRAQAEHYKQSLQDVLSVENLCGRHQIDETAGVLLQSELVFATESALAHLSVALRKPTVAILGGGHYGLFAPWGTSAAPVHWIKNQVDCYGCNWSCIQPRAICIQDKAPGDIVQKALQLMPRLGT